jgi:hypothetical protein
MNDYSVHTNGFIERKNGGRYEGVVRVEGIDLSPIEATFFTDDYCEKYLWLKRKPIMEYDMESQSYKTRPRNPPFEAYLKKLSDSGVVAYKGEFMFMRFKFSIVGVWDEVAGKDAQRMNLFVERLPISEQAILKDINKRKRTV